jgi:hypothetical protein
MSRKALKRARRSSLLVRLQLSKARRAAATALSTSSADPSEMTANGVSSAGLITSKSRGLAGGTRFPSM